MGEEPERESGPDPSRPDFAGPGSWRRKWIALTVLAGLCGLTWKTIDPGRVRTVVLLLLLVFGLRIVLTASAPN